MSRFDDKYIVMNLHEECLLKYLINPLDLFYSTELLKNNNSLIEKELVGQNILAQYSNIKYTGMYL